MSQLLNHWINYKGVCRTVKIKKLKIKIKKKKKKIKVIFFIIILHSLYDVITSFFGIRFPVKLGEIQSI